MFLRVPIFVPAEGKDGKFTKKNENILSSKSSNSRNLKSEKVESFLSRNSIHADEKSCVQPIPKHARDQSWRKSIWRLGSFFREQTNDTLGPAQAKLKNISFEVTKINQRGKEQRRRLLLSANGISNIRPGNKKVSSTEKWCDVLLCYKINETTIAIKYAKCERTYSTIRKAEADDLLSLLRERVNAYQEDARKKLKKRMVDGFDEKYAFEAVPMILKKYKKHANEDRIRKTVEEILLSTTSEFFKLKEKIRYFNLNEFRKVKELRRYLDTLKYKLFDENMVKLSAVTNIKDPEQNDYALDVIESMIESACLPSHTNHIYKLLEKETKPSDIQMTKIILLRKKPQFFFGIKGTLQAKDEWVNAVVELVNFPTKLLPSAKMECLLNTARQIHHQARRIYGKQITADDLLPIVIFVLVKASYKAGRIIITAADELFLKYLINPEALEGEKGYYLCAFSAALEFVRNYDRERIQERFSSIKRLNNWGFC